MYNIVITSGGTEEKIDEVRKITNNSTGMLGSIIANTLINQKLDKIERIFYLTTASSIKPETNSKIEVINTEGVLGIQEKIKEILENYKIDYFIHTMAISDYMVEYVTSSSMLAEYIEKSGKSVENSILENKNIIDNSRKISSNEDNLIIKLKKASKVISTIKEISPSTKLIGFKLLNNVSEEELFNVAHNLLLKNNCELVVANDSKTFVNGQHKAIFVDKNKIIARVNTKEEIARKLVELLNLK